MALALQANDDPSRHIEPSIRTQQHVKLKKTTFSVNYILRHMDFLTQIIDQDFGLRNMLFARQILTKGEKDCVQNKESLEKRNLQLLELMTNKSDEDRQNFLSCLEQSSQKHVVNSIHGITNDQCGDDLPLDEQRRLMLTTYYDKLAELLDCEEFVIIMYSKKCLSRNHKDSIQKKQTNLEKNEQLLDILFLRSIADFNTFVCCLRETGQERIANYFKNGGAIIDFVVRDSTRDSEIVEQFRRLLHSASSDELRKLEELVELQKQGVNLMDVQLGSVRLYFWCLNESSVLVLKDWVETGRLQTVIEKMFELVSSDSSPTSVRLNYEKEQFDRALLFFNERRKCIGADNLTPCSTADVIWKWRCKLVTIIDPNHGLLDDLFVMSVLDGRECQAIRSRTTVNEKVIQLLQYVSQMNDYSCHKFLTALELNGQTHVVNFINQNGVRYEDFGDDWPLEEVELIKLRFYGVFFRAYFDDAASNELAWNLQGQPKHVMIGKNLLSLTRRSITTYKQFVGELGRDMKVKHLADILKSSGVIVSVDGEFNHSLLTCINVDELRRTVRQITLSSSEQVDLANLITDGIELLDIDFHKNLLFFCCRDGKSFDKFNEYIGNNFIQNILEKFLTSLMVLTEQFSVKLILSEEEVQRCLTFVSDITENMSRKKSTEDQHIETDDQFVIPMPKMPVEVMEVLLLNTAKLAYSAMIKLQQQSPAKSAYEIVLLLISVCRDWWQELKRRGNKRKLRRFFKRPGDYRLSPQHVNDVFDIPNCCDGIVTLQNKLFVMAHLTWIDVYETSHPFNKLHRITLNYEYPFNLDFNEERCVYIAACATNNYIFINAYHSTRFTFIRRLQISDQAQVTKDEQVNLPFIVPNPFTNDPDIVSLSVQSARLVVALEDKLFVCDVDGNLIKEVSLPNLVRVRCAVESRRGTYVVCYNTAILAALQVLGEFNDRGETLGVYPGLSSWPTKELSHLDLGHLLLGAGDSVIVSEPHANRVLVFDSQLKLMRVETFAINPRRMCFDEETGLLFVLTSCNSKRIIACSMPHVRCDMIEVYSMIRKTSASTRAPETRVVFDGCRYVVPIMN